MYCISFMSFPHPQINSSVYSPLNFFLELYQHSNPANHIHTVIPKLSVKYV